MSAVTRRTVLKGLLGGSALAAAPSALAACARGGGQLPSPASGPPKRGGTFVSALYLEPTAIDPTREVFWETYRVSRNIYENLVQEDLSAPSGTRAPRLVSGLATAWQPSADYTSWTFTLRRGVRFHDGTGFDAHALDFAINRFADKSFRYYDDKSAGILQARFSELKATRVDDDHTFTFTFDKPYIGFPRLLAQSISSPLVFSPAALRKYGNDGLSEHPIGTGPYTFVERRLGDHITLQRNKQYWGRQPYLDQLVFRVILDDQSRLAALASGQVHFISRVQPTDIPSLQNRGLVVPKGCGAQLNYIVWNFGNEHARKRAVRTAVAQGIDLAGNAKDIYDGYANPLRTFLPPGNVAFDPDADYGHRYDPRAARATLAAAGIRDGEVRFNIITDLEGRPQAAYLADNLKKIGIEANLVAFGRTNYAARTANPEPDDAINLSEYGGTYPEWVSEAYASSVTGRGGTPWVDDATISAAIDRARHTSNPAEYVRLWQQADKALVDSAAVIPTVNFTRYYAYNPGVGGFVWPNTNWYDLSKVWLDRS